MEIEPELRNYLEGVRYHLRLDPSSEKEIVRELYSHIEDRSQELSEAGLSQAEATKLATENFGRPEAIAGEMYRVHSQGSWRVALLAAVPHLLIALLFGLHLWHNSSWIVAVLISMVAISAYGWRHGRPAWSYTWLGYFLAPILIAALLSVYALGQAFFGLVSGDGSKLNPWILLGTFIYLPLAMKLLGSSIANVVRRDWLYGSLMAFPLPAIACWLFALHRESALFESSDQYLHDQAPWIALSFITLATGAAAFIRLGQRLFKIGVLVTAGLAILFIVVQTNPNALGPLGLAAVALLLVVFLLSPALLEHKIGHGEGKSEVWIDTSLERCSEETRTG